MHINFLYFHIICDIWDINLHLDDKFYLQKVSIFLQFNIITGNTVSFN